MEISDDEVEKLLTIRDLMRWAVSRFNEVGIACAHGMENSLDEAVYLVLHALHLPPNLNESWFDSHLTPVERHVVLSLILRRVNERCPSAYLTHEAWFCGLSFYVDERVLIPRSPIAELIESSFQPWIEPDKVHNILDLGTGSGCIGIACAYAFPDAMVDLVDISPEVLEVAQINIENHYLNERVNTRLSDGLSSLGTLKYDIIVSNPPYVDAADMAGLAPEFGYEPTLGLAAGEEGLDVVIPLLHGAANHLNPQGILVVEVGDSAFALTKRFPDWPFQWLEFERGGHGVFLITREQIEQHGHTQTLIDRPG